METKTYLFCCKFLISTVTYHHISHFLPEARDDPFKAALFPCMKGNHRENITLHYKVIYGVCYLVLSFVPIFVAL